VGEFTIPEKISLGYASFAPGDFLKEIKLTNEDYEDYYKSYIDDFSLPARARASHILIKFGDDKEKANSDATAILEKVENGEDFATLAKKHSGDPGSANKGGDLGFFSSGMMVKPFEDAAFSMEKGEVSELVETLYGFHIIKLTDFVEEKAKPLAEVKGEIRKVLQDEISKELAQGRADDIYYEAIKGESLEALLKEEKISYKKTEAFTLDNIPSSLKGVADSVKDASRMEAGWIGRPIELDNAFFIITLLGKEAPREPVFDEVDSAVKRIVIKEKARDVAAGKAEGVLAMAKGGKSLKTLATSSGLKREKTGPFSRSRNFVPKIGISEEIVAKAFLLTAGGPLADKVYSVGYDAFVFKLKERKEIDAGAFEKEKELLRAKLIEERRDEVFQKWLEDTKGKASLEYHEDLLNLKG
ncbi:MAG: peptidylprolyl isomerase, partial [Proteobacteria bacterium]|nr:peptidylprolyl isomerase [Pseudomonadota bacterium]